VKDAREAGRTITELLIVVMLVLVLSAWTIPSIRAYSVEAHILGAGETFKAEFLRARSMAVKTGKYTAIRFEDGADGPTFSLYQDGDRDGVRSDDIAARRDRRLEGPFQLTGGAPSVRVGINAGVPAIPPDRGLLEAGGDPIRFGRSRMVSFSPLGDATPGTFYLAGERVQGAVRVNGGTARVRLLIWRGGAWRER